MDVNRNKMLEYYDANETYASLKKHAIRGGGISVLSRLINFIISMLSTFILARILSPEEFGVVAMITSIGMILIIFIDIGLTDATIYTKEITNEQISTIFWINIAVTFLIVIIISASSPLIAWFYNEPRLKNVTIIWSSYLLFSAFSVQHIALLKRKMLFLEVSINETIAAFISFVCAIILAYYGWGYWSLILRQVILAICTSIGAWLFCKWRPAFPSFKASVRSMLSFGRNATWFHLINTSSKNLGKILIGWRYGADPLGYYDKAYSLFTLPVALIPEALKNVATSTLSKLNHEPIKFHNYYIRAISMISFIGMPLGMFFMIESEDLILLLLGPQWHECAEIFQIMAAGIGVYMINSTIYWIHASLGRTDRLVRWGLFSSSLTVLVIISGLRFGPKGVAYCLIGSFYVLVGFGINYAGKPINLKFRKVFVVIWRYFVSALIAAFLCWYMIFSYDFAFTRIERLILSFALYSCVYLIFVVVAYKGLQPIKDFISAMGEMLPERIDPTTRLSKLSD